MHIEDALDRYVLQLRADGRSIHTVRQYQRHIMLFAHWLESEGRDLNVESIDHEVLALFLVSDVAILRPDGKAKRATSTNGLRSSLRTCFCYLHAAGITATNPARLVRRARCGPPPPRGLSPEDEKKLRAALDGVRDDAGRRDRAFIELLLATGLRVSSALALRIEDLDLEAGEITVRCAKGDRPMTTYVSPEICDRLEVFIGERDSGPLFVGRDGDAITSRHANRRLHLWLQRAKCRRSVSVHGLRHTFADRLYRRSGDLHLVQRALGHRSIASTLVYARCDDHRLRQTLAS